MSSKPSTFTYKSNAQNVAKLRSQIAKLAPGQRLVITNSKAASQDLAFLTELAQCNKPFTAQDSALHNQTIKVLLEFLQLSTKQTPPLVPAPREYRKELDKENQRRSDSALSFSAILEPLVTHLQHHQYSQRKMRDFFNEREPKIPAPHGGTWVLSQLQNVLRRIKDLPEKSKQLGAIFAFNQQILAAGLHNLNKEQQVWLEHISATHHEVILDASQEVLNAMAPSSPHSVSLQSEAPSTADFMAQIRQLRELAAKLANSSHTNKKSSC